ncbi:MAG: Bax inhibitor-1 family protein, partial [Plesiomonas sp.]
KVLRNTYFLLGLTLAFSAAIATTSMLMGWPRPGFLLTLVGFYGLLFMTERYANSAKGLIAVFALTGFMGYTLGPLLGAFLKAGAGDVILTALGGTALVFFSCSAYVLTTRKNMSFMGGMLTAGAIALLILMVAGIFLQMPAMNLAISALFVLFSSGMILFETSNIIHGGETNYIRATVSLYVSLYNLFISLLSILGIMRDE